MTKFVVLCAFTVAFGGPALVAQTTRADEVLIQFEIQKNGTVVAEPTVRMHLGGEAAVPSRTVPPFTVVATHPDGQTYILDLEFSLPDAKPIIRLRLGSQETKTATLTVGADALDITASVHQPS
jgi:hypothetical protein